jgi:hypothetical protein
MMLRFGKSNWFAPKPHSFPRGLAHDDSVAPIVYQSLQEIQDVPQRSSHVEIFGPCTRSLQTLKNMFIEGKTTLLWLQTEGLGRVMFFFNVYFSGCIKRKTNTWWECYLVTQPFYMIFATWDIHGISFISVPLGGTSNHSIGIQSWTPPKRGRSPKFRVPCYSKWVKKAPVITGRFPLLHSLGGSLN